MLCQNDMWKMRETLELIILEVFVVWTIWIPFWMNLFLMWKMNITQMRMMYIQVEMFMLFRTEDSVEMKLIDFMTHYRRDQWVLGLVVGMFEYEQFVSYC